jgi:hypothetical protein
MGLQWLGYPAASWTVPLLHEALHRDTGQLTVLSGFGAGLTWDTAVMWW